jgi:hypothetical protein
LVPTCASADKFGVSCGENGPRIGPIHLLKRTERGFEPRWVGELDFVLSAAMNRPVHFTSKMGGLKAAADALEKGDLARAMLVTQFMWLPSLPDEDALRRAVDADSLAKSGFNPDQPRDEDGRWSSGGTSDRQELSGIVPVQDIIFPDTLVPWLDQVRPADPLAPTPPFRVRLSRRLSPFPEHSITLSREIEGAGKSGKTPRNIAESSPTKGS